MLPSGKTTRLRSWSIAAVAFLLCFTNSPFLLAQGQTGGALKIDDFGDLKTEFQEPRDALNIELLSQSQLIAEAEKNRYTIRRLEFIGNEHIRDQVVRRRLRALQEGEIFTKKALTKGLLSLNRPGDIYPVRLDDVDIRLDRREKTVDLRIVIKERRRQL